MSRYDLTDFEWRVIQPLLPNKPRGVWIGVDAGPPSNQDYYLELVTETVTMLGSPSAPMGTPALGRFRKRNQFSKRDPGRFPFQRRSTALVEW